MAASGRGGARVRCDADWEVVNRRFVVFDEPRRDVVRS
jgi:hypothetical protein